MDSILQLFQIQEQTPIYYINLGASLLLSFFISFIPATSYKLHHTPQSFNPEFYPTLIIFAVITSYITLIIGGNVARAFGLFGTLSIIRFRTPLKDPLDIVYIFWALALGMSCGTGFYLSAMLLSVFVYLVMSFIRRNRLYEIKNLGLIVRLRSNEEKSQLLRQTAEKLFQKLQIKFEFLNRKLVNLDNAIGVDLVYEIFLGAKGVSEQLRTDLKALPHTLDIEVIDSKKDIFL